jgi:hypothetical protein
MGLLPFLAAIDRSSIDVFGFQKYVMIMRCSAI